LTWTGSTGVRASCFCGWQKTPFSGLIPSGAKRIVLSASIALMTNARFWAWFDRQAIDGLVDGSARGVRTMGRRVSRIMQRGNVQMTICYTVSFIAVIMIAFIWL
jgi:hypothetical protein